MYERFSQEIVELIIDQTVVENFSERDDACHWFPASARDPYIAVLPLPLPRPAVPLNPCLSACALVSRSWVQRSRHHHFRSLDFRFFYGDELAAFVDIIRSPLSTINLHVTEVKLDQIAKLPEADAMALAMLSNVQSVVLDDDLTRARINAHPQHYLSRTQPTYLPTLLACFTHLKHLKLSCIEVNSFTQLVEIICANDNIETLSLCNVEFTGTAFQHLTYYGDILEGLRPPPTALRAFSTQAPWSDIYELLYLWLASSPTQLQIDTLDLLDSAVQSECVPNLLKSAGLPLESFAFRHERTDSRPLLHSYDLRHNTRLKSLTIYLEAYRMPEDLGIPADMVAAESDRLCNIIEQITSPVVETITFAIDFELAASIRLLDLAEMDAYFQRPNFASLQTVRVEPDYLFEDYEGYGDDHPAIIQEWLQATFPRSLARGIIDCGFPQISPSRLSE